MKLVLDTNVILVSISSRSKYHWIFQKLIKKEFTICITNEILNEYAEIIGIHMGQVASDSIIGLFENMDNSELVKPYFNFNLLEDRDDNKFVDCAIASNADYIITNDKDFNILKKLDFPKIALLSIVEFGNLFE